MTLKSAIGCATLLVVAHTSSQEKQAENALAPVSFSKQVAPILVKKCVTCHGPEKSKGHFRLDSFDFLLKAGESKSAPVVPSQPEQSELVRRLTAKDEDDRMPQKDDPLPAEHIGLIERWIKDGAKFDGADPKAPLVTLIPKAPHPDPPAAYRHPLPVTALAFNLDGNELAVERPDAAALAVEDGNERRAVDQARFFDAIAGHR